MSFRCEFCGEVAPPGTPQRLVPVKVRRVEYPMHMDDARLGSEIVQEKRQCATCYSRSPEAVEQRMNDGKTYSNALRFK